MSEISLTASMRSNLLSLQQIAKLQDSTQLRLSTGLKVNSAIDNPSSYYTASSLNNRAEDLSALLDSMGQSVQTIKAATEGIEKAEDLLSQMKAIAEQVNTGVYVPEKSYFEKLVGANGAVVSTAEELRAAVDSGKEEICVYGKIDLGDISTSGGINLKENQKLVGVNYYGNFGSEGEEFSSISATATVAGKNLIDITKTGCLISNLNLSYENDIAIGGPAVIRVSGSNANLANLNIKAVYSDDSRNYIDRSAISINASTQIGGNLDINVSGSLGSGIFGHEITFLSDSLTNIKTFGSGSQGVYLNGTRCDINSGAILNIENNGSGNGLYTGGNAVYNINSGAIVNIVTSKNAAGISLRHNSQINIMGNLQIKVIVVFLHRQQIVITESI